MAKKNFQLIFPDHSRKHISAAERDTYLLAGEVKQLSPTEYLFTGEDRSPVVHSLRDLNVLVPVLKKREAVRRFLKDMGALTFVQPDGKKQREFPETPEGMVLRLKLV